MTQDNANLDAVPAAIARTDADRNRTDKAALRPGKGAGNTHPMQTTPGECSKPRDGTSEPVAWAVMVGGERMYVSWCKEMCEDEAYYHRHPCGDSVSVVPLYRQPQPMLTDAEREAVEAAVRVIDAYDEEMDGFPSGAAATLRDLLDRTSET